MVKGTNRAYKVVPVEDEPDFGDPPRNWARVASMTGVWALLLLGTAWMAPGFASGGGSDEVESLDEAAASPNNAARRYLRFGSNGDIEQANAALCEQASPQVTVDVLVEIRDDYGAEMRSYPSVDPVTEEPVPSGNDFIVESTIIYDDGHSTREEQFAVTVTEFEVGSYCVSDIVRIETGPDGPMGNNDLDILRFIVWDRDVDSAAAVQCPEYSGPTPQELLAAVEAWESEHGDEGTSYAVPTGDEAQVTPDSVAEFPYEVVMDGDGFDETFPFNVTVSDSCVLEVSGGEGLLMYTQD